MTSYVALLRAINLAGLNKVGMADLRELAGSVGCTEARTLLQSGNLVFRGSGAAAGFERRLRQGLRDRCGVDTDFFVRSAAEWGDIVSANPFPREAKSDPGHLLVVPLSAAPGRDAARELEKAIVGRERVGVEGRTAYIVYPDGVGTSKLTMAKVERTLGVRGTGRNWNTVLKIAKLLEG